MGAVKPTLKTPALPVRPEWKATASPQAMHTKTVIEAKQAREKIPIDYKPTLKQEPLSKSFKMALANSAAPNALNNSTKSTATIIKGDEAKKPEKPFTAAASPPKDNKDRGIWHKEVTVKITSLDQARTERAPIIIKEAMDSPKVWKVEASDKGKVILERMQADIRERKATTPPLNNAGYSGRFNHPTKIVTDDEVIQKVRTEATAARAKVPPDMRAEAYSPNPANPKPASGLRGAWQDTTQPDTEKPKQTMGSKFNNASQTKKGSTYRHCIEYGYIKSATKCGKNGSLY